jgi:shikimate dehydrogenase
MLNKDTQLCISVASRPSNFGTTLHNAGYEALGLNFAYKAFETNDIAGAIGGVRALNIRGCSVSMPFKESVIPHLDALDDTARIVGAVNTVVNESGVLTGYNTDVLGALKALESLQVSPGDTVLILGAGGVARAVLFALRLLGISQVRVANRHFDKIQKLNTIISCTPVKWMNRESVPVDILINATCVGMSPNEELVPLSRDFICQSRVVMDVIVSPMETRLVSCAKMAGSKVAPGYLMSLEQAIAQFTLYTGLEPPRELLMCHLQRLLGQ